MKKPPDRDHLLGDESKPAINLVEPDGVGRYVVNVEAVPLREAGSDLGVLMRAVVANDHVDDVQALENRLLDLPEEPQEFLVPMTWLVLANHLANGHD